MERGIHLKTWPKLWQTVLIKGNRLLWWDNYISKNLFLSANSCIQLQLEFVYIFGNRSRCLPILNVILLHIPTTAYAYLKICNETNELLWSAGCLMDCQYCKQTETTKYALSASEI